MRAMTCEVAGPPAVQRDGKTTSSPFHSPAKTASLRCSSSGDGAARWSSGIGLPSLDSLDDLLRGVVEVIGGQHVWAGFPNYLLARIHIGGPHPHHPRHLQAGLLHP